MLRIKDGVELVGLSTHMVLAAIVVSQRFDDMGLDAWITSGSEGCHREGSLHYVGRALDFRSRHVSERARPGLRDEIAAALGENYDVVLEATHYHCEHDPK